MHYDTYLIPYQRELEDVLNDVVKCRSDIDQILKDKITLTSTNLQAMREALVIAVRLFTEIM